MGEPESAPVAPRAAARAAYFEKSDIDDDEYSLLSLMPSGNDLSYGFSFSFVLEYTRRRCFSIHTRIEVAVHLVGV